jgi:hypothetical protein
VSWPSTLALEFVGLPGAGKSTVAAQVRAALAAEGLQCGERYPVGGAGPVRYFRLGCMLARQHRLLAPVLIYGASVRPLRRERFRRALELPAWPVRWRASASADIVIYDEGLVQNLWSVVIDSDGWNEGAMEGALEAVACGMPQGFRFVYFDLDVDTALARIRQRPGQPSRFDRMAPRAAGRLLTTHRRQLEWILERTLERTGAPCLRLNACRDPDALTREVLGFVASTAP